MLQPRWFQTVYRRLGLELWLPLPLLGLGFWVLGGFMADRVLSRGYPMKSHLQANIQPDVQRSLTVLSSITVLSIEVEIEPDQGVSRVAVKPANSALKKLTFEFPVTELSQVEAAIAQELDMSPKVVRKLVNYQVENK